MRKMNKMVTKGLTDNWDVLNVWNNQPNGNGIYLAYNNSLKRNEIIIIHSGGYLSSFVIVYDDHSFRSDHDLTRTTQDRIQRAINYAIKHDIEL